MFLIYFANLESFYCITGFKSVSFLKDFSKVVQYMWQKVFCDRKYCVKNIMQYLKQHVDMIIKRNVNNAKMYHRIILFMYSALYWSILHRYYAILIEKVTLDIIFLAHTTSDFYDTFLKWCSLHPKVFFLDFVVIKT